VKKGQLLAQLDKSLMLAQVQQISANLQQAKANLTYQQSNFERQDHLFQAGAISKADQETALYQYNTAKDNVNSVAAQLSSANRNLSFTDIYSPIDGTVLSRSISEGQTVASSFNTPTLFSIAKDLTKMQVRASVDEADIGNVGNGQRVSFTVDAFPEDTFAGIVKDIRLQPSTSANVVTYTTIVDAPNADLKLKPGMTASIIIYTKEVPDALLVPNSAFQFKPDSAIKKIYTVQGTGGDRKSNEEKGSNRLAAPPPSGDNSKAAAGKPAVVWIKQDTSLVLRHITTGMTNETERQVLSGLTVNDEVVTGYQQVKKDQNKSSTDKSPFMPARRQGNNKNNRPPQ
jgi:HlyD family secretion protein